MSKAMTFHINRADAQRLGFPLPAGCANAILYRVRLAACEGQDPDSAEQDEALELERQEFQAHLDDLREQFSDARRERAGHLESIENLMREVEHQRVQLATAHEKDRKLQAQFEENELALQELRAEKEQLAAENRQLAEKLANLKEPPAPEAPPAPVSPASTDPAPAPELAAVPAPAAPRAAAPKTMPRPR